MAAAAISSAQLYDEQRRMREDAERANRQAAFLAEASTTLASSLDYEATLQAVANLVVPEFADWCAVDVVDDNGRLHRVAVAHADPERIEFARTLQERYPEDPQRPSRVSEVVRTGNPVMVAKVTDEMLAMAARDAEHLRAIRSLGITSYISVPLTAHGRRVGALTFVSGESGRDVQRTAIFASRAMSPIAPRSRWRTPAPTARSMRRTARKTNFSPRCRTSCARRSTPCSAGRACCGPAASRGEAGTRPTK